MFDSHIHTNFSSDSSMTIEEVVDIVNNKNIGVVLTEHLDLNFPDENMFKLDVDSYFKTYEKYRTDKLLLGIEIGFDEYIFVDKCKKIANSYDFDFVLGSVHIVEGIDLYYEEYYKDKKTGKFHDLKLLYNKYFNAMLSMIKKNPYFDSLGHIDYIVRYATRYYENPEIDYKEYSSIIDEIFKELILMDKAIEINTRRLDNEEAVKSLITLYKRFKELGGKYVTIGSDSHENESIGVNFVTAKDIADECKLIPVYFKNRKMIKC